MSEQAKKLMLKEIEHCQENLFRMEVGSEEYAKASESLAKMMAEYNKLEQNEVEADKLTYEIEAGEINQQLELQKIESEAIQEKKKRIWGIIGDFLKVIALIFGEIFLTHYIYNQEEIEGKLGDKRKLGKIDLLKRVK